MAAADKVVSVMLDLDRSALGAGGVVHVVVEEVTRADAPATVAARLDLQCEEIDVAPLLLRVPDVDASKRYSVRVHVDRTGNGRIKPGDMISTQSHPVLTQGAPDVAHISPVRVEA